MNKEELLKRLEELGRRKNEEWLAGLESRKLEELRFHDKYRDSIRLSKISKDAYEKIYGNKRFYNTIQLSMDYVQKWLQQHAKGKIFLDYACGNGINAIRVAKAGAELAIGVDISDISVKNARESAYKEGVSDNTYFVQGDCENTGLPANCIDLAICSGMLHHLDLSCALYELKRILKPSGIVLVIEALNHNPLIRFYRNITPQMRTQWEKNHILSYREIAFASRFFDVKDIRHWHLFSVAGAYIPQALPFLDAVDRIVLRTPILKKMSWMVTFEMHKR